MLALADDAALARLVIAATRIPRGESLGFRVPTGNIAHSEPYRFRIRSRRPRWKQTASCLLEREDCTLVAWYPSLYAPRAGGAYDSHHRTAGIAGCTRQRGSDVAARGARAAAGDAGDWAP